MLGGSIYLKEELFREISQSLGGEPHLDYLMGSWFYQTLWRREREASTKGRRRANQTVDSLNVSLVSQQDLYTGKGKR